ncbi:MAG: Alkaline phosphatase synthesis transcriptional regulatory protein PhoP [Syntrophorhabdus sp. PtaB.Bin184]|nr:MAG: Alkaline phosphatase synthesis transcriptional regulatory protein PhoP [Syntrophorhabdus sp. PtaB.Bin184]
MDDGKTILIVDDDEYFVKLLADELGDEGYTTKHASNGVEAILVLKHLKPSLIILDIVMPVMDGMEVLGPIVRRYEDVPVILHSSYEDFKKDFKSWSADAYLVKSPDFRELKGVIRSLLSKNRRRRPSRLPQPGV